MLSFLHAPMASTVPSLASYQSVRRPKTLKLSRGALGATNAAKIPMPPLNPRDAFLQRLASVASSSPERIFNRPVDKDNDIPPYLDLFDSPNLMATPAQADLFDTAKLMATPAQVERSVSYSEHRPTTPPPDLPSMLLHGRIVYIGMPLVPAVTELVVAELMYLQWQDPNQPIYVYINSTGTTRDDGETVGMETEGFAIYDTIMQMKNEIHTVGIGAAIGQACLLLSAGTKGKRFMMPHAKAMIQQPRVPSSGLMPASDVLIRAKEVLVNRDTLVELLAKHTGNSKETVANAMRRPYHMDAKKALEFGVIDKIHRRGGEKIAGDVPSQEEWGRIAGVQVMDDDF